MKTITRGGAGVTPALLLMLMAAPAATPTTLTAQSTRERVECRCVDRDGNEIEGCTCLRGPDTRGLVARFFGPDPRPRLGITLDPGQPPEDDARGARVVELFPDGPADDAGLREGDLVVRFDGHDLTERLDPELEEDVDPDRSVPVQRLLALARRLEPGQEVEMEYLRDGERRRTTLEARELERWGARAWTLPELGGMGRTFELRSPAAERLEIRAPEGGRFELRRPRGARGLVLAGPERLDRCPSADDRTHHVLPFGDTCPGGLRLVALNPGLGDYFGTETGVLVADVHAESSLGLRPGDVIQRIGAREADSPERVRAILRSYEEDEPIPFHVVRDGREMDVQGRLRP